jgi:hypothetical protein
VLVLPTREIVVAEAEQNRLYRMSTADGELLRFPSPGTSPIEWTALASSPGLAFYALDGPGRRVHQYDFQGNYLGEALDLKRLADEESLGPIEPGGLAVDRSGHGVVTDRLGDRLLAFGPGWVFQGAWGQSGADPGSWRRPGSVAVGNSPPYLVADEGNRRVVLVDAFGEAVATRDLTEAPRGVAVLGPGRYAVTYEDVVEILDRTLLPTLTIVLPRGADCSAAPYATTALAGDGIRLWVGEGCSGRLRQVPVDGD